MTGSLQIKNGKYYAVINTYQNGKRKQKWINTQLEEKGNKRKAEQILHRTLLQFSDFSEVKSDVLFSDYLFLLQLYPLQKVLACLLPQNS